MRTSPNVLIYLFESLLDVLVVDFFETLMLALFLVFNLYPCDSCLDDDLDRLLSMLVGFLSCVFVIYSLGVSSVSPMFDLGSWDCLWFYPFLVTRILQHPP